MQETRQTIVEILKARGHATVEELAEALALTPMTVRHHLSILEERKLVATDVQRGRVGRPHYVYHLTPAADELFPKAYHILAERVLAKIKEHYGPQEARSILQDIAGDLAEPHLAELAGKPLAERLIQIEEIMAAEGFRVRVTDDSEMPGVEVCNCAYRHVAAHHPEVCELDRTLLESVLGRTLVRVKHAPAGDDCCRYRMANEEPAMPTEVGATIS
ncbi:MAG: DeoR family transcriptional regulator [Anaerolineae bacterium]